jgi:hypothetical protein
VTTRSLAQARQAWRAAEARLYPLAMVDVDGYQRALVLVAAVSEELRAVASTAHDLLPTEPQAAEYVMAACEATGASARGLDPEDIFGSAAAVVDRELAGLERRRARLSAIERGRASGSEWTDVHGDALGPLVPELRIHTTTGRAIVTEIGGDPTTGAPVLLVTTAVVDLATGELGVDPGAAVRTVPSADAWAQVAAGLQDSG